MNTILLVFLVGCFETGSTSGPQGAPDAPKMTQEQAWDDVRATLLDGRSCYRRMKTYCVDDPEYVDKHIQAQLDRLFNGQMPVRPRDVVELGRKAQLAYATHQRTPEGAALVQAQLEAYYAEPDADIVEDRGVNVRMGLVAGKLTSVPGQSDSQRRLELTSARVDRGELSTIELATQLTRWLEAFPDQPAVRLSVQVPDGKDVRVFDIRYIREEGQLDVRDAKRGKVGWRAMAPDLAPYLAGQGSLHSSDITACTAEKMGAPLECGAAAEDAPKGAPATPETP